MPNENEKDDIKTKDVLFEILATLKRMEERLDRIECSSQPRSQSYAYEEVTKWLKTLKQEQPDQEK